MRLFTCWRTQRLIDLDVEGLLPADQRERLVAHLACCPRCRETHGRLLELQQNICEVFGGLDQPMPLAFAERCRRMLAEQAGSSSALVS